MRIVQDMGENGAGADFFIGKRRIACVFWDADGNSEWEEYFDEKGKLKREVNRHWNGRLMYLCRYKNGFPHGVVRQWDDHGGLLLETRFKNGTGFDLWWSCGLAELRELVAGHRHGVEQWWRDSKQVYEESYFRNGLRHGVSREWKNGRLRRGFPAYHLAERKVTRRQYAAAFGNDSTLPADRREDDDPHRKLLPAAQRALRTGKPNSKK
jgi:hypothetical protein